jgi:hypothetical protein
VGDGLDRNEVFSAETRLMLCVAAVGDEDVIEERVRLLAHDGLDWRRLLRLAEYNQVLPLLYLRLNAVCRDVVPTDVWEELEAEFRLSSVRNLALTRELATVLGAFNDNGIPVFSYKGPLLAGDLYTNLSMRHIGDLDLMARKRDVAKARELLLSSGYGLMDRKRFPRDERDYLEKHCEYHFLRSENQLLLELHWQTLRRRCPFGDGAAYLWERVQPESVAGVETLGLPPDVLLLVLVSHGDKHRWERLKRLCDVARLVDIHRDLDWDGIVAEARGLGMLQSLCLALYLAHALLEAPIPEPVARELACERWLSGRGAMSVARMTRGGFPLPGYREWRSDAVALEGLASDGCAGQGRRPGGRWGEYARLAIEPGVEDRLALDLPRGLSFLHYLARPLRYALHRIRGLGSE